MSVHTEDGRLVAYLDRELPAAERASLDAHLQACLPCRHALARVRSRADTIRSALGLLDHPAHMDRAWAAVQSALGPRGTDGRRPASRRSGWSAGRWTLARAAGLVLVLAGGAAAAVVPGSPIRAWLLGDEAPVAATAAADAVPPSEAVSGSWTLVVDGHVTLELAAPSGTEIQVVQAGERAGVRGPADTRYSSVQDGHLRAEATAGPLRVELPTTLRSLTLRVNGDVSLTVANGLVATRPDDALGALDDAAAGLRFTVR